MKLTRTLKSPLFTSWAEQYARLTVPGLERGTPGRLTIGGRPAEFQYTGDCGPDGAEVMVRLGFEADETRELVFVPTGEPAADASIVPLAGSGPASLGHAGCEVRIAPAEAVDGAIRGPLAGVGRFPLKSTIRCSAPFEGREVVQRADGPLYSEYEVRHRFAGNGRYDLRIRCYRHEPIIEVAEDFFLGMGAGLTLTLNPSGAFDTLLSHGSFDFDGDGQPVVEPLVAERPKDVLCRLQMPMLSEYTVPNNRGWWALYTAGREEAGMLGIMGLYGAKWVYPVQNIMTAHCCGGRAELSAALESGRRFWMLYTGPVEKGFEPGRRFVFHRLHAEWNALRLDEHLDLTGDAVWDEAAWDQPGFFREGYRERARENARAFPPLAKAVEAGEHATLRHLIDPTPESRDALVAALMTRFAKWVRQFQGWREGQGDYAKNVIGFSRALRGLMMAYELLRKDGALGDGEVRRLNAYFCFAARRIMDEGRWPHSKTMLHPDHPESTRGLYAYPGEHVPDKLVWTNCLPNFQSDPLCALAHLGALIPGHPDAHRWRRKALDDIENQLTAFCGENGAWEESINYALYTLSYFIITFRILKSRLGVNYFQDRRVRAYVSWLVRFVGPLDKRWGAYTWPGVGNAVLPQNQGEYLLAFAGELEHDDPLRADLVSVYQKMAPRIVLREHAPLLVAEMASPPEREHPIRPLQSEVMDGLGVAMRHEHPGPRQSYLVQKIGFWKDHYEADESAFNWYAKGTPLTMDYGTYTADAGAGAAHNLVEIPDMDSLRRGYLAATLFSPAVDYSRSEIPVTLKLLHGRVRTFEEIDGPPQKPKFFYIGDDNPVGPRTWKRRLLLFVKPDYLLIFDRVFGPVPHRYNLHVTADGIDRNGARIFGRGRFDLDLLCFVQHPAEFGYETGELVPGPSRFGEGAANPHRQRYFRLYNRDDGIYRTVLFAAERGREVQIDRISPSGVRVTTPEYTDYAFASDEMVYEQGDGFRFAGRVGWIRRAADGNRMACMPDGDGVTAFGLRVDGRGPWTYNMDGQGGLRLDGVPRQIDVRYEE